MHFQEWNEYFFCFKFVLRNLWLGSLFHTPSTFSIAAYACFSSEKEEEITIKCYHPLVLLIWGVTLVKEVSYFDENVNKIM